MAGLELAKARRELTPSQITRGMTGDPLVDMAQDAIARVLTLDAYGGEEAYALAKARRKLTVTATDERVEAAARRRMRRLKALMRRLSKFWAEREIDTQLRGKVEKAAGDGLEKELARLLERYGIRDASDAGEDMATRLGTDWILRPSFVDAMIRDKKQLARGLAGESRSRMRKVVRETMREAMGQDPVPSTAEIARRIRAQLNSTRFIEFDAMRAERIARTEAAASLPHRTQASTKEWPWRAFRRLNGLHTSMGKVRADTTTA